LTVALRLGAQAIETKEAKSERKTLASCGTVTPSDENGWLSGGVQASTNSRSQHLFPGQVTGDYNLSSHGRPHAWSSEYEEAQNAKGSIHNYIETD